MIVIRDMGLAETSQLVQFVLPHNLLHDVFCSHKMGTYSTQDG